MRSWDPGPTRGTANRQQLEHTLRTCPNCLPCPLEIEFGIDRIRVDDGVAPLIEGDPLGKARDTDSASPNALAVEIQHETSGRIL